MNKIDQKEFHPNSKHQSGYNFEALCKVYPELETYVFKNKFKTNSIDFGNPKAVKALNTAILKKDYQINFWEFPDKHLCPPIPGRVDYLHYLNDLFQESKLDKNSLVLDIGTGANCIYPLLGVSEFDWNFLASDVDEKSLEVANQIIEKNQFQNNIETRLQTQDRHILKNIIQPEDRLTACMCNPPFYKNETEANAATKRKLRGLKQDTDTIARNFSGTSSELWCEGGEERFLKTYIHESTFYKDQCHWFTSLVSKKEHVRPLKVALKKVKAKQVKVIKMKQGLKETRILAWSFKEPKKESV